MNKVLRFAMAGALMAGYATAQAQTQPSSNASDLWLFVSDNAAGTTFAEDTGVSLSSIMPTGSLAAGGTPTTLSTAISASFTVGPTAALTSYINAANSAGQALTYAVEGANFNGSPTAGKPGTPGAIIGIASAVPATSGSDSKFSQMDITNLETFGGGLQGDIAYLAPSYAAGGKSYKFSDGSTAGNVWGSTGFGNQAGSVDMYGQGPDTTAGLGSVSTLYGLTGNKNAAGGPDQSYVLGTNLKVAADGTLSVGQVPLPAAVWLLGSGLLGLVGVGRRRAAA